MLDVSMYIDGEWKWRSAKGDNTRNIFNPATGEVIATAAEGNEDDAQAAITAARKAFDSGPWPDMGVDKRAEYLFKIADNMEEKQQALTQLETMNNGKTFPEASYDVSDAAACFRYYGELIKKSSDQTIDVPDPMQSIITHEPIGVCGLIVPWNFPLLISAWKLAPALAAGNTVILKPAEITPLTAIKLFEIFDAVGLPNGVANLVLGAGDTVGNKLATDHEVDKISFTGGTETGRHIMRAAAGNIKDVSLELGGKSPNIIFADADFETAVDYALYGTFFGAGQVCTAGSRILVEESIHDLFIERLVNRAKNIKVKPGNQTGAEMGPLVSEDHFNNVMSYIEAGQQEGATLRCGGKRLLSPDLENGFFVEPTIFTDVKEDMKIVQEEIFGPVAVVQTFKDEQEAIRLANGTDYGLAGSVFTTDDKKAMRVIKKVRAGITWINAYHAAYNEAPWGGYKQSGIGRGLGTYGLEEFQEVKQINVNLQVEPVNWFSE
ncbi:aldehyde dehydrogenase family protein [Salicibibacter cibarius]|uniref:Aldehyde dehydrogenase n=1 Tax=Salicibibacter cibarius TaxID=2743000 RepID=A0A7T7CBP6_9BACI|nr:aldehyde dehydrogenase family protein [Salicibibacter cibarius]QQK76127.1 aldehyde dehydrogenase family protein [Salicibibacter cibarius]